MPPPIDEKVIKFQANVNKVQTLADGGLRLTLDLPEHAIAQVGQLMLVKKNGGTLEIVAVPIEFNLDIAEELNKGSRA